MYSLHYKALFGFKLPFCLANSPCSLDNDITIHLGGCSMKKKLGFIALSIGLISYFLYFQNNSLVTTKHTFTSPKVPSEFDGMKIIHLSDLHNKSFGKNQNKLVSKIKQQNPDLVFITGDIIDSRRYDAEPSVTLVKELVKFVPVYYVTGNHEARSGKFASLETALTEAGAHVMRNTTERFVKDGAEMFISGVDDPAFNPAPEYIDDASYMSDRFGEMFDDVDHADSFHLLLSHRPELIETYALHDFDMVFSGHAHGGQIRIPFLGGLIAPDQGLLPDLTEGLHTSGDTALSVSRGLGNSLFPFRILNRPEIVVIELGRLNID